MSFAEIKKVETELYELTLKLNSLRRDNVGQEVPNYEFKTLEGTVKLSDLFAGKSQLMVIHNMGQGCRYCTLWADGLNPFIEHLETAMSVVLVSKDDPQTQRRFANSRGWRMRMASHGGGAYMQEQSVVSESDKKNAPGVSVYEMRNGKIVLKNRTSFGPYDQFCSVWNFLSLAGQNVETWTPQYDYWKRPSQMDDGGNNLN